MSEVDLDEQLMSFVNAIGVIIAISLVLYHIVSADTKDAEIFE